MMVRLIDFSNFRYNIRESSINKVHPNIFDAAIQESVSA